MRVSQQISTEMVAATAERHDGMMTLTFDGGFIIH